MTQPLAPRMALRRADESVLEALRTLLPYINDRLDFRRDNVDRLLGSYPHDWRDYLPHLLAYAVDTSFLHRSERTVHEQILYRMASKSRPITYHDIQADGIGPDAAGGHRIVTRTGKEVRQDVLVAMAARQEPGHRARRPGGDRRGRTAPATWRLTWRSACSARSAFRSTTPARRPISTISWRPAAAACSLSASTGCWSAWASSAQTCRSSPSAPQPLLRLRLRLAPRRAPS